MGNLKLHIVAFDVPDPPDYGGAIDVFYKVKNLAEVGVDIYLHCPQYGERYRSENLEQLCKRVFYYERNTGLKGVSASLPYMVYSRKHPDMLRNLQNIDAPIFFDGVSTSYYLSHPSLKDRLKILRPQNVEQDYYRLLGIREEGIARKIYYYTEARLLRNYENRLQSADAFFTVALHDHDFFKAKYPKVVHEYIPSFQPYNKVESKAGKGDFCIYHGNLAIAENKEIALYLLKEIIPHIKTRFVIAGRNPGEEILALAAQYAHCSIIPNPSMKEMDDLVANAQVHVIPTFQNTGLKLKLLHALFRGRHVLVNNEMIHGTGLSGVCQIANGAKEMIKKIGELAGMEFDDNDIRGRERLLQQHYSNKRNAERIITFLQQRSL